MKNDCDMKTPISKIKKNLFSMDNAEFQKWLIENLDKLIETEKTIIKNECVMFGTHILNDFENPNKNQKIPDSLYGKVEDFYNTKFLKKEF
jgi:hypothetical protein